MKLSTKAWQALGRYINLGEPFEEFAVHIDEKSAFGELAEKRLVGRVSDEWLKKIQIKLAVDMDLAVAASIEALEGHDWDGAEHCISDARYAQHLIKDNTRFYVPTELGREEYQKHQERLHKRACAK